MVQLRVQRAAQVHRRGSVFQISTLHIVWGYLVVWRNYSSGDFRKHFLRRGELQAVSMRTLPMSWLKYAQQWGGGEKGPRLNVWASAAHVRALQVTYESKS